VLPRSSAESVFVQRALSSWPALGAAEFVARLARR
jgi:hypothetical protein